VELREFLEEHEGLSEDAALARVLEVTSAPEHQANIALLDGVDDPVSPVEWIVSVSMLSEGWDVKNVFQIVPHEERAFNSKLLISQVLGRGLRVPEGWAGEPPVVTVFNHDSWSGRIRHLVNEVLEVERRLTSRVVKSSEYHFSLSNLDYSRNEDVTESTKKGEYRLLESGFVALPTQVEREEVTIGFERAISGERASFRTEIHRKTYSAEKVAEEMYQRLRSIDEESSADEDPEQRTHYAEKFPFDRCLKIVKASLERARISSGTVTDENRQRFLQALGTLRRGKAKRVVYRPSARALFDVSTTDRPSESCSAAELRRGSKSIAFGPDCAVEPEEAEFFEEVRDPDGDFGSATIQVPAAADFKSPVIFVIADSSNERRFVRELCKRENTKHFDTWLKNAPQRFYWVEYAWKKGTYPKRGEFSPDFFIRLGTNVHVVEIKGEEEAKEPSIENTKKYEYAVRHFQALNGWLEKEGRAERYWFNFLTPSDFNAYFQQLRAGQLAGFQSAIDVKLSEGAPR
jgi:type III restriction enzyme